MLTDELALCKKYLRMEKQRLGERLQVAWHIEGLQKHLSDIYLPKFILQPLLENAVYHGIQTMEEGGVIAIEGELQADKIKIVITNPYSLVKTTRKRGSGYHMAQANIQRRLQAIYGQDFKFDVQQKEDSYRVLLIVPQRISAEVL